ncbi:MAG: TonB-dependent receptor, partial [Acidobacteria bacterium]|nr:TonB-dependent receptor [Acidobacteriota bacterium]
DPTDSSRFTSKAFDVNLDTQATSGSFFISWEDVRQRTTWSEDLNYFVDDFFGRHDIKTGMIFEHEYFERDLFQGMVRSFRLQNNFFGGNDTPDQAGAKFIVNESFGIPEGTGGFNHLEGQSDNYGIYITDTWLPLDNLAINAGLRLDREEVAAAGFSEFDPRAEFNTFQRYLVECLNAADAQGLGEGGVAQDILARMFPNEFQRFLDNLGEITEEPIGSCVQGKPFFLTFPKKSFTDDCRRPDSDRLCTTTLDNFSPVLAVLGNRPEDTVNIVNNNLSPRFNISWDPWSNGKTRFFASWGRFYDKVNLAQIVSEQGPDVRGRTFIVDEARGLVTDEPNASDPDVTVVDRNLETEFKDEWTIGFEREIAPETKIRLTWISNKFRAQLQDVDYNHFARDVGPEFIAPVRRTVGLTSKIIGFTPIGGPALCEFDPVVAGLAPTRQVIGAVSAGNIRVIGDELGVPNGFGDDCFGDISGQSGVTVPIADGVPDLFRRNLLYNNVLFLSNLNFSNFDGFTLEFIRRMKRNWQLNASWTHGRSVGAADNFADESGNDPSRVADEFGFTGFDERNVLTVAVTTILPWGDIQLGSLMTYFSGTPFSIRERSSSFDAANQNTFRTEFPTRRRNDQRNDSHLQIDVTVEKQFLIKKYNASAQFLVENLLADDFLTTQNLVDGQLVAFRNFGRQYEVRFKVNF